MLPASMANMTFWQTVMLHVLTVTPATLLGIAAVWKVVIGHKQTQMDIQRSRVANSSDLRDIHLTINSRMDQLIEAASKLGFDEGVKSVKDRSKGGV